MNVKQIERCHRCTMVPEDQELSPPNISFMSNIRWKSTMLSTAMPLTESKVSNLFFTSKSFIMNYVISGRRPDSRGKRCEIPLISGIQSAQARSHTQKRLTAYRLLAPSHSVMNLHFIGFVNKNIGKWYRVTADI